jgi:hypothetical protein
MMGDVVVAPDRADQFDLVDGPVALCDRRVMQPRTLRETSTWRALRISNDPSGSR